MRSLLPELLLRTINKQYPAFHNNKDEILFERVINAEISGNTVNKMTLNSAEE